MKKKGNIPLGKDELGLATEFIRKVDWSPLHDYLQKTFGFDTKLSVQVIPSNITKVPILRVQGIDNLIERTGIFRHCFRNVYLQSFGTSLYRTVTHDEKDEPITYAKSNEIPGPLKMSIQFDLLYEDKDFGKNGTYLFYSEYTDGEGWHFS